MSLIEAAGVVGCSAKAVETRLYRARALLRESLAAFFKKS
jgi:DNA-directed RNA polymerase specialized sigma24 family protein